MDIGLIRGEHRRVIGVDGCDFPLHSYRRKLKIELLAPARIFGDARQDVFIVFGRNSTTELSAKAQAIGL
jgi:hypothetical protein